MAADAFQPMSETTAIDETAEHQGALLYSLRAATLLARLCQSQGRADEADAALRPIYARFTEGFDFPDLIDARALLEGRL